MTNNNSVSKFIEFLNSVLTRPAMYNVNNIEDLELVLFGYLMGISSNDKPTEELDNIMIELRQFINKEFNSQSNVDWARIIRFYSGGDKHSLDLFKMKFDKFWSTYENR